MRADSSSIPPPEAVVIRGLRCRRPS